VAHYVTDTHALLWHLSNDPQLSPNARAIFLRADAGENEIFVPSIVVVEVIYLTEKKRVPAATVDRILDLLDAPMTRYHVVPLDMDTVRALRTIDREAVPDMPNRVIVATALQLGMPLITRDADIAAADIVSVVG